MSTVFVANGTLQHREFPYRVVEARDYRTLRISAGCQAQFPEDFTDQQLENLEVQLQDAGGVPVSEINAITSLYGLIYKVDRKPIAADIINAARVKDESVRQEVSGDKTEAAGLTVLHAAEKGQRPGSVREASLEIVQLKDNDREEPEKGGVDYKATVSRKRETEGGEPGKIRRTKKT